MKWKRYFEVLTGAVLIAGVSLATLSGQIDPNTEPLLLSTDLVYQGSFRAPAGMPPGYQGGLDYGGRAIAFNPTNNSLFIVGHDWYQMSAEISIPSALGRDVNALPSSTFLQPLTDALEGKIRTVTDPGNVTKIGGQLVYKGKLYLTDYVYYDGLGYQQLSHFYRPSDLSARGQVQGPFRIGPLGAGFYDGYFSPIPVEWQPALGGPVLNGNCCLSIISRTSYGPAAFAMDPESLGVTQNAAPLVYYTGDHPEGSFDVNSTQVFGAAFPNGSRSVLFFGKQGLGASCYGEGTSDPALNGLPVSPGSTDYYCYDPTNPAKGGHAYPYTAFIWAYDASDLAAVKAGRKLPWSIQPYGRWPLQLPFGGFNVVGASYDPSTNRLFVSQGGDYALPVIHVFRVNTNVSVRPAAPRNVVVRSQ